MPLLLPPVRSEPVVTRVVLQPPSPEHFDADPDQQDEEGEEEEPEQQTAYQKLLSTLSQPASKDLSEESSESEEEEEELLNEGGLFYLKHNKGSMKHFEFKSSLLLFALVASDGDGEPSEDQTSGEEKGGEEEAEEPLRTTVQEGEREDGAEEFIDEEHESQFCLETNFNDEEEEETDRTLEHHDSTGKIQPTIIKPLRC